MPAFASCCSLDGLEERIALMEVRMEYVDSEMARIGGAVGKFRGALFVS